MRPIGVSSSPGPAGFVYWGSNARTGGLLPRAHDKTVECENSEKVSGMGKSAGLLGWRWF